jgi:hypothetical protein
MNASIHSWNPVQRCYWHRTFWPALLGVDSLVFCPITTHLYRWLGALVQVCCWHLHLIIS